MFPAEKSGQWEPNKIWPRRRANRPNQQPNGATTNGDATAHDATKTVEAAEDDADLEEDPHSDAEAVWPMQNGCITNWPCFFALMEHCFKTLGGSFHMPIMLIAQPVWSAADHMRITRFFFESFKCPAFALIDSAQATCYAFGVHTACVVDIGKDKADVTAVTEHLTQEQGRAIAVSDCGGEAMTQHLFSQLRSQGFNREMSEQLKLSSICEILPPGTTVPGASKESLPKPTSDGVSSSSNAANGVTNTNPKADGKPKVAPPSGNLSEQAAPKADDNEGVLDVATIVTGGRMNEYIEKKEQEKQEKQASRKKGTNPATGELPKPVRLKNSEKEYNTFIYRHGSARDSEDAAGTGSNNNIMDNTNAPPPATSQTNMNGTSPTITSPTTGSSFHASGDSQSRVLTVGPARFEPLPPHFIPLIASTIRRVIEAVPIASQRPTLWDSLIITGAGSRIRGFPEALVSALSSRYIISPSSATMFTSEIPSNFSTPGGTGANTPQPQPVMPHGYGGGQLNMGGNRSLLQAATTASASQFNRAPNGQFPPGQHALPPVPPYAQGPSTPGQNSQYLSTPGNISTPLQRAHFGGSSSGSHSQAPTSIKIAKLPEYFAEWREPGADSEAVFLGAQVASKVFFLNDVHVSIISLCIRRHFADRVLQGGHNKGYMSRSDYNETGPQGIVDFSM